MKNKPKQTAVQWLTNSIAEEYNKKGSLPFSDILILVYKALEMEKQQIVKAVNDYSFYGNKEIQKVLKKYNLKTAGEEYYYKHYEG